MVQQLLPWLSMLWHKCIVAAKRALGLRASRGVWGNQDKVIVALGMIECMQEVRMA